MSKFLSALGQLSARFRWVVLSSWALIFALLTAVLVLGGMNDQPDAEETALPDTAASAALERMNAEFPSTDQSGETLQLVFHPDGSPVTDADLAPRIQQVLDEAAQLPGVQSVSDPFDPTRPYVSEDQELAVATLDYGNVSPDDAESFQKAAQNFQASAPADLGAELGNNLVALSAPPAGVGEAIGVVAAFIVLALTFGSLLAAGANLLIAVVGVGIGVVGILAYGTYAPMDDNALILAAMLGLAVGIDYSLFILSRYKTELRAGKTVSEAIGQAVGTAGTAVVFAGMTVIVALCALMVADIDYVTQMGLGAAFAVLTAVLLALTMLPAVMRILGLRILTRAQRAAYLRGDDSTAVAGSTKHGVMFKWGDFVVKRPVFSLLAGVLTLVVVALPMLSMKTAFSIPGGADPQGTERSAYNLIVDEFGGTQSPLMVLVEGSEVTDHVAEVEQGLTEYPGVRSVTPAQVNDTGDYARIIVTPEGGPIDERTKDLVHMLRDEADAVSGVHLEVTGETAIGIDQDEQLMSALITYVCVIVVLSMMLLIVLFRSLLVPLIATVGYLLSVGASFGASVAVFQWGWFDPIIAAPQGDPMMSLLPLILVGVLFGLAMDYQVFLVSRIQEMYHRGLSPRDAVREGFARSGPVLVAAASIMVVVFAGFASSSFAIGASIALGLLVGVAADAFIVRLVLTPALLTLLGHSAWWLPRWLDRILPDVDVEGRALESSVQNTLPTRESVHA
ncbi:MMPL family transporter [Rothia sp. AR01]|uniref:MMPL family transporter n=1 Tax=Rothia santali TaxID=2949643 RepID=A0A9X2KHV8_9MICC|nr:MMPL family transporter [Rothia santali]MCP3425199.1 MMPL family transporter [Rothia santali]